MKTLLQALTEDRKRAVKSRDALNARIKEIDRMITRTQKHIAENKA